MIRPLHHYYHVYAVGDWSRIVNEHIDALIDSGLLTTFSSINVGIVGAPEQRAQASDLWWHRCMAPTIAEADEGWEQTTLIPLWRHAQQNADGAVLYAHTKGVANKNGRQEEWRRAMVRHLVTNWTLAVPLLDKADAVGIHRVTDNVWPYEANYFAGVGPLRRLHEMLHRESDGAHPFDPDDPQWDEEPKPRRTRMNFSGNFWWARMDWCRKLPKPRNETRYDAENWIGAIEMPRIVDLQPGHPHDTYPNKETPCQSPN